MMQPPGNRSWAATRTVGWLALALVSLAVARSGARAAAAEAVVVPLAYTEMPSALTSEPIRDAGPAVTFKKEPAWKSPRVVRGMIELGGERSSWVPFAWVPSERRLFLDLNRNLDLTDDPRGVLLGRGAGGIQTTFSEVHVDLPGPTGARPVLLNVNCYDWGARAGVQLELRSLWQGRWELNGQSWQVGMVEDLQRTPAKGQPRYLLLRPWTDRAAPLSLGEGTPDLIDFPHQLFFHQHAFRVTCRFLADAAPPRCELRLAAQVPPLGSLKVLGDSLRRLVLTQPGGYTVVLDGPEIGGRVPAGTYTPAEIWLQHGTARAVNVGAANVLAIHEQATTTARLGGPLTNSATITRRGKTMTLTYALVGAEGLTYRLVPRDYRRPPQFRIEREGRQVAAGQFRYG